MNKFQKLDDWLIENFNSSEQVTILYPGGFKPMTGGHLDLIKRYINNIDIKELKVLIGPGVRNGITQDIAYNIATKLTESLDKVIIEAVKWPSPILTAYKMIGEATPGIYALASSSKGNDYKRVQDFVEKHNNGKYPPPPGVKVIEYPLDVEPKIYKGRTDEYNGQPISASILRQDIINDDYQNFETNYPENTEEEIRYVWNQLAGIVLNESVNFDKFYISNLYNNILKTNKLNESQKLYEGGGAGHMLSPWENLNLTFGNIIDMVDKVLSGKIQNITEKLDGSNIMATFKDGNTYLARSTKHLKNYGENAILWTDVKSSMHEKLQDRIKQAFQDAINDLQIIFSNLKTDKIFNNGKRWLNIELINPNVENIIPYNTYQLRIHNIIEINELGKTIKIYSNDKLLDNLDKAIKNIQSKKDLNNIHLISKTNTVVIKNLKELKLQKSALIKSIQNKIMKPNHLDSENTIGDFLAAKLESYLDKNQIVDPKLRQGLINRWAYGIKNPNINKLLKEFEPEIRLKVKELDKNIDLQIGLYLDEIIDIFTKLGILVLQNLDGIMANNPSETTEKIRLKTRDAINKINKYINRTNIENKADFEKKVIYLKTQLRRLKDLEKLEGIAPIEGIVFEYNGQVYKLTGVFLPILKIINFFNFGKDK